MGIRSLFRGLFIYVALQNYSYYNNTLYSVDIEYYKYTFICPKLSEKKQLSTNELNTNGEKATLQLKSPHKYSPGKGKVSCGGEGRPWIEMATLINYAGQVNMSVNQI